MGRIFTVALLIDELSKLPPGNRVMIRDADTSWWSPRLVVESRGSSVLLSGDYDSAVLPDGLNPVRG